MNCMGLLISLRLTLGLGIGRKGCILQISIRLHLELMRVIMNFR